MAEAATIPALALDPEKAAIRGTIVEFEGVLKAMPQIDIPLEHFFAPGLYLRQMTMPKDSVITGKIHKTEHLCILAKGEVTLVSEDGRKRIQAPFVIHSMPGTKRAIYAHDEAVWINCHHNSSNETDLDKIDQIFVAESYEEFLSFTEKKQIEGGK